MRVVIGQLREPDPETMRLAKQLGINGIQFNTPLLPGDTKWQFDDLRELKQNCEDHGLKLEAIENVPIGFYHKAMLGLPGRDEQIENYRNLIGQLGRLEIPVLGYHFVPNFVWRTRLDEVGRGGARVTAFDLAKAGEGNKIDYPACNDIDLPDEDSIWKNYQYFIKAVLPVAEEVGVDLALHPDDPPVPELDGVHRLFYKPENFKRAMEFADSEAWKIDLCTGTCSSMANGKEDVLEMIRTFGPLGKIAYVHFRDVQGSVPRFQECFLGEGNFDPVEIMGELHRSGFDGFVLSDHVPTVDGDSSWGHRAHAHAIGYLQALISCIERKVSQK